MPSRAGGSSNRRPRAGRLADVTDPVAAELSPTPRTRLGRLSERGQRDRAALLDVLDNAMICHLGIVVDGAPVVLPTVFAYDLDGPDRDGTLYVHGSVAARSLRTGPGGPMCVTVTVLDGLVLARSGFHHSMNYRSAVVHGEGRLLDDPAERDHALRLVVDQLVPGRSVTLRAHTRKELVATAVVALPLHEASVKVRSGDAGDDVEDIDTGQTWAGVLPLRTVAESPRTNPDAAGLPVPADVAALAESLRADRSGRR